MTLPFDVGIAVGNERRSICRLEIFGAVGRAEIAEVGRLDHHSGDERFTRGSERAVGDKSLFERLFESFDRRELRNAADLLVDYLFDRIRESFAVDAVSDDLGDRKHFVVFLGGVLK